MKATTLAPTVCLRSSSVVLSEIRGSRFRGAYVSNILLPSIRVEYIKYPFAYCHLSMYAEAFISLHGAFISLADRRRSGRDTSRDGRSIVFRVSIPTCIRDRAHTFARCKIVFSLRFAIVETAVRGKVRAVRGSILGTVDVKKRKKSQSS